MSYTTVDEYLYFSKKNFARWIISGALVSMMSIKFFSATIWGVNKKEKVLEVEQKLLKVVAGVKDLKNHAVLHVFMYSFYTSSNVNTKKTRQ